MTSTTVQREDVRNRLLRRVDWRFLLPDPSPFRTVSFAEGSLAEALHLVSSEVCRPMDATSESCNLAVVVDPDPAALRRAWDALAPGGACYAEWYRKARQKHAVRSMESAGFQILAWYRPWPHPWPHPESPSPPKCWIPLEARGARRFVQRTPTFSFIPGRLGVRSPVLALHRMRMLLQLRLPLPRCAIAIKPENTGSPGRHVSRPPGSEFPREDFSDGRAVAAVPRGLRTLLQQRWPEREDGTTSESLSWLLLTPGARAISKVVGLVFAEPEADPSVVVKMPRVPVAVAALKREAETLNAIHADRSHGVAGVPRVLFSEEVDGMTVLAETFVGGVPLWSKLRRSTYRELAVRVTDWLADFAGHAPHLQRSARGGRLVDSSMHTFTAQFGPVLEADHIRATGEALDRLDNLPIVCEQRDFGPWNVLVARDGSLGVLDWESAELQGLPALDLIYFLSFQAFFHDRVMRSRQFRPSYRTLLDGSTFTGRVFAECLARYGDRVGLDPGMLHPLRLLCWMIHARSDYRHLSADVAGPPQPEDLRRSSFLSLWEEEVIHGQRRSKG